MSDKFDLSVLDAQQEEAPKYDLSVLESDPEPAIQRALDTNADKYAKTLELAKESELPTNLVELQPELVDREVRGANLRRKLRDKEFTKEWFSNPDNAKVGHDDVDALTAIENGFSSVAEFGTNALKRGGLRVKQGYHQYMTEESVQQAQDRSRSFGEILKDERGPNQSLIPGPFDLVSAGERYITSRFADDPEAFAKEQGQSVGTTQKKISETPFSPSADEAMKQIMEAGQEGILPALKAAIDNPGGTMALSLEVGAEFLPQLGAATAITAVSRNPAVGAGALGSLSGMTERYVSPAEFLQREGVDFTKDMDRVLADPDLMAKAKQYGFTRGMIIGAFDAVSGGIAGETLSKGILRNMLLQSVAQAGLGGGGEATAQLATDGRIDAGEVVLEAIGELATAPVEVLGVGGQYVQDVQKSRKAKADADALRKVESIPSKLEERSPDRMAEFKAKLLKEKGVESVSVPAEQAYALAQEGGYDAIFDLGSEEFQNALSTGGDIEITPQAYFSLNREQRDGLIDHLRFGDDAMTAYEAEQFETEGIGQELEDLTAQIVPEDVASQVEDEFILRDMQRKLQEAGVDPSVAVLEAQRYKTRAERAGVSAKQLYERDNLQIVGPETVVPEVDQLTILLDKARSGNAEEILGLSKTPMIDALKAAGGVDPSGTLAAELQAVGVTNKTHPGLYRKTGIKTADAFVQEELDFFDAQERDETGYVSPDQVIEAVRSEVAGNPLRSADDQQRINEFNQGVDDFVSWLDSVGLDITSPEADIRAALDGDVLNQLNVAVPDQQTAFEEWAGTGSPVINPEDINDFDFTGDGPFVLKAYHGTTHQFEEFDATKGNKEGHFGAVNYFTSDRGDAEQNYAGSGPDLTARIEQRAEQIQDTLEEQFESRGRKEVLESLYRSFGDLTFVSARLADMDDVDAAYEAAKVLSSKELHGGADQTLEVYIRTEKPFVVGGEDQWLQLFDSEGLRDRAIEELADEYDVSPETVEEEYEDELYDRIFELEADTESPVFQAIETVASRFDDVDAGQLVAAFYEFGGEFTSSQMEELLRKNEASVYATDPETGAMSSGDLVAQVIQEMGYDSIILKNAGEVFPNMGIGDAAHIHVFHPNRSNIKSATDNVGTFSREDPNIFKQGQKGSFQPGKNIITLTKNADQSTILHELGHKYLFELQSDAQEFGSEGLKGDWDTVTKWWADNAASLKAEAIRYASNAKDEKTVTELAAMSDKQVAEYVRQGVLTAETLEQPNIITENDGAIVSTGKSVTFDYVHNKESATKLFGKPKKSDVFGRGYEPSGKYLTIVEDASKVDTSGQLEAGTITLNNPLVVQNDNLEWKKRLSNKYGGKTGKELSKAIIRDGYDSVITLDGQFISEIVEFQSFDEAKALYQDGQFKDNSPQAYLTRAMNEQWARGFEDYLRNGQAPSVALAEVFAKFRAWLVSIYKALKSKVGRDILDVQFSEEVRDVMDRMLASDEEIELVRQQYDLKSFFTSAEQAGMTETQFQKYQRSVARSVEEMKTRQLKKHLNEIERTRKEWWLGERSKMESTIREEVEARPEYRALYALVHGLDPSGEALAGGFRPNRLNRAAVLDVLGNPESLQRLPKIGSKGVLATGRKEPSIHPDVAAGMFGFNSGEDLLIALMNTEPLQAVVDRETDAAMKAEFGDMQVDETAIAEALESAHIDRHAEVLAMELQALSEGQSKLKPAFVRQWAKERVGAYRVGDIRPSKFTSIEKKAAKEAGRLLRKGDRLGAARAKFKQLMNYEMAKQAYALRDQFEKDRTYLKKFNKKRAKFKSLDADYVDRIKEILGAYNLGPKLSDGKILRLEMAAFNEWVQAKEENDGAVLVVPQEILSDKNQKHYRELTVDEYRTLVDTVRNLEAQGRLKKTAIINGEQRYIEDIEREILNRVENLDTKSTEAAKAIRQDPSAMDRGIEKLHSLDAALRKTEFLLEYMDGEKLGPAHQAIFQPVADAEAKKNDIVKAINVNFMDRLQALPKEIRKGLGRRTFIPEIGREMTRGNLIMMALNVGNESNLDKMIRGSRDDAGTTWTEEGIMQAVSRLSKEEWTFVQEVWDSFDVVYPEVQEIYRRENGVSPEKIEGREIELPHGTYQGKYFPMLYDPRRSGAGSEIEAKGALEAMQSSMVHAGVFSGMTKGRTNFAAPVLLDIEAVPQQIVKMAHYVSYYEPIRFLNKLTNRKAFEQGVTEKLGAEYFKTLKGWIGDIAADGKSDKALNAFERVVEALRTNVTIAIMGFSYTTGMSQVLGYYQSLDALSQGPNGYNPAKGGLAIARGLKRFIGEKGVVSAIETYSGEMRHRIENIDRDVTAAMKKLSGKKGAWKAAQRASLLHIAYIQYYMVDVPTWLAAQEKGLREGMSNTDAVKYADSVIRTSQTAGGLKDLTEFQKRRGFSNIFNMFYSFFNLLYNLQARAIGDTDFSKPRDVGKLTARALVLLVLPTATEALMRGEWPEEDEDYASWLALKSFFYAASSIPLLRDLVGVAEGYGYSSTPLNSIGKSMGQSMTKLAKDYDEGELQPETVGKLAETIGYTIGVPVLQTKRVIRALDKWADDGSIRPIELLRGPDRE